MKYIIDTDPGIDDAIAIMIAYLSKLDIIGFTLTEGNIELKHSENNLKIIEDLLESDIKIYKSENPKLSTFNFAFHAHGKNGLGDVITDQSPRQTEKMSAEEFIINSSKKYEDNLTIVCFGPLTNLANAIKKDPEITKRITRVVIMGTSYNPKAKEPYHEFNLKVDPVSAEIVLNSKLKDILIITHETGIKTYIEKEYIESLEYSENKISRFLNKIAKTYMDFSYQNYNVNGLTAPDPVTIASVINPKIVTFEPCKIKVNLEDKGVSEINLVEESNIKISTDVNLKEFQKLFKNIFK